MEELDICNNCKSLHPVFHGDFYPDDLIQMNKSLRNHSTNNFFIGWLIIWVKNGSVYKKSSSNSVLTIYLGSRDVICHQGVMEPLRGVITVDPKFLINQKMYGQLTLTFRYGREDEEVMGLKFCNEAIIAFKQIWPPIDKDEDLSSLQEALISRLGRGAYSFSLDFGTLTPPSVQLIPAKRYTGEPIGTSYDVRVYIADQPNEERLRHSIVRLGVRVIHKIPLNSKVIIEPLIKCSQVKTNANNPHLPSCSTTSPSANSTWTLSPTTLRLRLSPKALKLTNKLSTCTHDDKSSSDENNDGGNYNQRSTEKFDNRQINNSGSNGIKIRTTEQNSINGIIDRNGTDESKPGTRVDPNNPLNLISTIQKSTIYKGPEGSVEKPFLWTDGRVSLRASLDKSVYGHGEHIFVQIDVRNNSRKFIRKIRVVAVQHVDVCMFSNGKFKNIVADVIENHQIKPNEYYRKIYSLLPVKGPTKNWVAVEGMSFNESEINTSSYNYNLASSAPRGPQTIEERNVFAIYVSYYIKVKLALTGMGGEVSLKVPFILGHVDKDNYEHNALVENQNCLGNADTTDMKSQTRATNKIPSYACTNIVEENSEPNISDFDFNECEEIKTDNVYTHSDTITKYLSEQSDETGIPHQCHIGTSDSICDDVRLEENIQDLKSINTYNHIKIEHDNNTDKQNNMITTMIAVLSDGIKIADDKEDIVDSERIIAAQIHLSPPH